MCFSNLTKWTRKIRKISSRQTFRFFQNYYQTKESLLNEMIFTIKIKMMDLEGFPAKNTHLCLIQGSNRGPGEKIEEHELITYEEHKLITFEEHKLITYDEYAKEHIMDAFTLNPEDFL